MIKSWAVDLLACPACGSSFELSPFSEEDGMLECMPCRSWYPVLRGIPRLLPAELREGVTREFVDRYRTRIPAASDFDRRPGDADPLGKLKEHTAKNFGFEWLEYARFGWDEPGYSLEREGRVFEFKSLLSERELRGMRVLDAGCGNGRYSYWAAMKGASVVGMDLGEGVESARQNTRDLENVQIVQGDIFNPPFFDESFDAVFSIGVLMHTGDAHKGTVSLSRKVKPGGTLTVHLYGKGNAVYELVDAAIRRATTTLEIDELQRFTSRAFALRRMLERLHLASLAERFVRLDSHPHCIFDWYAAPIATHHTYSEVRQWFDDLQMTIEADRQVRRSGFAKVLRRIAGRPGTVTVKARRRL